MSTCGHTMVEVNFSMSEIVVGEGDETHPEHFGRRSDGIATRGFVLPGALAFLTPPVFLICLCLVTPLSSSSTLFRGYVTENGQRNFQENAPGTNRPIASLARSRVANSPSYEGA